MHVFRISSIATWLIVAALPVGVRTMDHHRFDSDGYYCTGSEYLAYQFGLAAPSSRVHHLHVVPFRPDQIMAPPMTLELPQFQVHGLVCGDRSVRLAAWEAVYTVGLGDDLRPTGYVREPLPEAGRIPVEFTSRRTRNLGSLSRVRATLQPERTPLLEVGGRRFVLETTAIPEETTRCSTELVTRLVEIDSDDRAGRTLELFRGQVARECGD